MPTSPRPKDRQALSFTSSLVEALLIGETVTRIEWEDPYMRCKLMRTENNFVLVIHCDGDWHPWTISEGDLLADDWVIYVPA